MKSADEIKKGLDACNGRYPCDECPYRKTPKGKDCKTERNMDAIACIQQLESKLNQVLYGGRLPVEGREGGRPCRMKCG